jgi:hypothetical protein
MTTSGATPSPSDHSRLFEMIMGSIQTQAVRTLASMSVAEHLADGPLGADEIAKRASTDPRMTYRLLRAGVAFGLLTYDEDTSTFAGTPMLGLLHQDAPVTLKHYAIGAPSRGFWLPALHFPETVASGANHVEEALGSGLFEYFGTHPDEAATFATAMTELSVPVIREAVRVIDAPDGLVVDLGGAEGAFVGELVAQNPGLRGLVLELPHSVPAAQAEAARRGLADRITAEAGDFFAAVPEADLYLLKFVLHDWDDDACVRLLSNVRAAMRPGARVLVVEMVISPTEPALGAALLDLAMMNITTGRERELEEYRALLGAAGLTVARVVPVSEPYRLIEAVAG